MLWINYDDYDLVNVMKGGIEVEVFIIYRFHDREKINNLIIFLEQNKKSNVNVHFLEPNKKKHWRKKSKELIVNSELVLVFDYKKCMKSNNSLWEIGFAARSEKKIILLDKNDDFSRIMKELVDYRETDFLNEFREPQNQDRMILYKTMVETSEKLIDRRQKTNVFFVTAIGTLISILSILPRFQMDKSHSMFLFNALGITGIVFCNSWRNLISNYGKLNTAKFKVILELEKSFSASIFTAEWIALLNGDQKKPYKSFTKTEQYIPVIMIFLILVTMIVYNFILLLNRNHISYHYLMSNQLLFT